MQRPIYTFKALRDVALTGPDMDAAFNLLADPAAEATPEKVFADLASDFVARLDKTELHCIVQAELRDSMIYHWQVTTGNYDPDYWEEE
jgi:hypothetical protein